MEEVHRPLSAHGQGRLRGNVIGTATPGRLVQGGPGTSVDMAQFRPAGTVLYSPSTLIRSDAALSRPVAQSGPPAADPGQRRPASQHVGAAAQVVRAQAGFIAAEDDPAYLLGARDDLRIVDSPPLTVQAT